ncbi:MAG: SDR family oxidoreductase [Deltaproteobacteria bacterium]|nr:SDR family oxidoreductase [Deltaproteobacteria bacterium]
MVVTGANSGVGFETALALAGKGAHVVLACRNQEKGQAALERIHDIVPAASVALGALDLADLASVRAFAEALHGDHPKLDVLVNNAGIMAPPLRHTADGFELQFGTNHFGHFALTGLVLDLLHAEGSGRLVTVSSYVHHGATMRFDDLDAERSYRRWPVYLRTKLANLLFAFELDRRLRASALDVISVASHPGYATTHLQAAGTEMGGFFVQDWILKVTGPFAQSARQAALPSLYAATAPDVQGGEFYGPNGWFGIAGHPKKVKASRAARNVETARQLWEISVERTGVDFAALA